MGAPATTRTACEIDKVEWVRDLGQLDRLEHAWRTLEATVTHRTHVSTFDFLATWYRHYAGDYGGAPLIGLAWRGPELAALAPFAVRRGTVGRIPVTRIDFAPTDSIAGEFLIGDHEPELAGTMVDGLIREGVKFDVICLNGFDPASGQIASLQQAAARHRLTMQMEDHAFAVVDLREGYDAYWNRLSGHYRRNLNQKAKKIAAAGFTVEGVKLVQGADTIEPAISRMIAINEASYKLAGQRLADCHRNFLAEVSQRFHARGLLSLPILTIGGRDAAFMLGVVERGCFCDITLAYNESFAKVSPGGFLMQHALRQLAAAGVHTVISHGAHHYKKHWSTAFVPQKRLFLFAPGPTGTATRVVRFGLQPLWNRSRISLSVFASLAHAARPFSTVVSDAPFRTFWKRHGYLGARVNIRARSRSPARNAHIVAFFARLQHLLFRRATCEWLLHFSRAVTRAQATTASFLCFGLLLFPSIARAQARMEFIPSMSLFTVYDDNIYARVNGSAGQMLQLRPSLEGSYENPLVRLLGLYSFDMQRSNFSSLNTLDARRHALGETRVRTSPFTTLGLVMRYDRSETPGEIDMDSGFLGERRQAERFELNPTFARRFDTRTSMTAGYDWTTENLIDGERGTLHIGRATLSRDVTARTTLSAGYVGRYFVDHIADHTSHGVVLGWNRELAPGTRVSLFAGPKVTSYGGLTPEASASFARSTNRIRFAVDYWHGETIVLGVVGPVRADSITTRSTWPLTRRFELSAHAGVSDVTTLDDRHSRIYRGTLGTSWSPGGLYTVGVSYGLDYQDGTIRNRVFLDDEPIRFDDQILRHVFRVSVTVAPRYSRSILPPDEAARAKGVSR